MSVCTSRKNLARDRSVFGRFFEQQQLLADLIEKIARLDEKLLKKRIHETPPVRRVATRSSASGFVGLHR